MHGIIRFHRIILPHVMRAVHFRSGIILDRETMVFDTTRNVTWELMPGLSCTFPLRRRVSDYPMDELTRRRVCSCSRADRLRARGVGKRRARGCMLRRWMGVV